MTRLALAIATCGGVGYVRFAPGTFGSLLGVLLWAVVPQTLLSQGATITIVSLAGMWAASEAERYFNKTDPGAVVIDEVAGILLTLFMIPAGWGGAAAAFLAFRIFDILKPYPANRLERLHGGLGIVADDLMAGVYANVAMRVGLWALRVATE